MKINIFLLKLVKENIVYLATIIVILIIYPILFINLLNKINQFSNNIFEVKNDIKNLEIEANLINYQKNLIKEKIDIDKVNKIFHQLIPDEEDYFSAIFALERLSEKTGFIINNYSINFNRSKNNKFSLTAEGIGNQESFFNFLKDYRYQGLRLLTIDQIEYHGEENIKAKLNLYFYSGKPPSLKFTPNYQLNNYQKKIIKQIEKEFENELENIEKNDLINKNKDEEYLYPTKADLFQNF